MLTRSLILHANTSLNAAFTRLLSMLTENITLDANTSLESQTKQIDKDENKKGSGVSNLEDLKKL